MSHQESAQLPFYRGILPILQKAPKSKLWLKKLFQKQRGHRIIAIALDAFGELSKFRFVNLSTLCLIFCCRSKKRQDPFQRCPDDISSTILSYLSFPDLAKVCRVSKRWKELANDPDLLKTSVYRDIAFGHLQWTLCHNQGLKKEEMLKYEHDAKEFESLPPDIGRLLKSSCPAFPGKRVIETHMLVRLPKGFTLNTLGMLAKKYFPQNPDGYRFLIMVKALEIDPFANPLGC